MCVFAIVFSLATVASVGLIAVNIFTDWQVITSHLNIVVEDGVLNVEVNGYRVEDRMTVQRIWTRRSQAERLSRAMTQARFMIYWDRPLHGRWAMPLLAQVGLSLVPAIIFRKLSRRWKVRPVRSDALDTRRRRVRWGTGVVVAVVIASSGFSGSVEFLGCTLTAGHRSWQMDVGDSAHEGLNPKQWLFNPYRQYGAPFWSQEWRDWWPEFSAAATDGLECRLRLPTWCILLMILVPWLFYEWRAWHAVWRELCRRCGYDLTGNVSGVCPECGAGVESKGVARDEASDAPA
jgi:hypothetical protein